MRTKIIVAVVAFLALTGFILKTSIFRPAENFHVVDEGKFYRMAQPTAGEIEELVKKYGIKTVVNLRGKQEGEWWYDNEAEATKRLGLKQIDIAFATESMQFKKDWGKYLDVLENAERPILVHCRSGADRTSEATAVYAIEFMHSTPEKAIEDHMGYSFLHVPILQPTKTEFVRNYKGMKWLREEYYPCDPQFRQYAGDRCLPEHLEAWEKKFRPTAISTSHEPKANGL